MDVGDFMLVTISNRLGPVPIQFIIPDTGDFQFELYYLLSDYENKSSDILSRKCKSS